MKKERENHSREYAVEQLNLFFDEIDLDEDLRIQPSMTEDEQAQYDKLVAAEKSEQELELFKEKCDINREMIISLIRRGLITFDENMQLIQHLRKPIKTEDGEVKIDKLKYKSSYTARELSDSLTLAKRNETPIDTDLRIIALRTGANPVYLEYLKEMQELGRQSALSKNYETYKNYFEIIKSWEDLQIKI